jgi:hypothetical protein
MAENAGNPAWWTTDDTSTWERVKEAIRRDWNQTKHDFGLRFGENLNQDVTDTVRQAVGATPIPGPHVANDEEAWSDEAAVRYGYGAALSPNYRDHAAWGPELEAQLKSDWEAMGSGRTWDEVRLAVRYGWTRSPRTVG